MNQIHNSINSLMHDSFIERGIKIAMVESGLISEFLPHLRYLSNNLSTHVLGLDRDMSYFIGSIMDPVEESLNQFIDDVRSKHDTDLMLLISLEVAWLLSTMNKFLGTNAAKFDMTNIFSATLIKSLTLDGASVDDWWTKFRSDAMYEFLRRMRIGISQRESVNDLIKRIRGSREYGYHDGLITRIRKYVESFVRTSVMSVINDTRLKVFGENRDLFRGIQWRTLLDFRVCPMCRPRDGAIWDIDGSPVNEVAKKFPFRTPPIHFNDRCILLPIMASWESLVSKRGGNAKIAQVLDKMSERTRSSMDGEVPDTLTFTEWLRIKDESDPSRVEVMLGKSRYKLWKSGRMSLDDFLDDRGRVLRLEELNL
jgi:hypothetical protein